MDHIEVVERAVATGGPNKTFEVRVGPAPGGTVHTVTLSDDYWQKLTHGRIARDQLVLKAFEFLLNKEPKEAILPEFDLPLIQRYFADFEETINREL